MKNREIFKKYGLLEDKVVKYDKLDYKSGPVKVSDYISNKYDYIHNVLYLDALKGLYIDLKQKYENTNNNNYPFLTFEDFLAKNNIIEIKKKEYFLPSVVIIRSKTFPYIEKKYSLDDYWNAYQFMKNIKKETTILYPEDIKNDAEMIYIDYVKGKAKMRSKSSGEEYWISFEFIDCDTPISLDELSLNKTFVYMLNEKDKDIIVNHDTPEYRLYQQNLKKDIDRKNNFGKNSQSSTIIDAKNIKIIINDSDYDLEETYDVSDS
jgi:hypothetical protein